MVSLDICEVSNDQLATVERVVSQSEPLQTEVKYQVDIVAGRGIVDRFERWKVQDQDLLQTGHGNTIAGGLDLIDWRVDFNSG